jgi:hypothetical protein
VTHPLPGLPVGLPVGILSFMATIRYFSSCTFVFWL